MKLKKLFAGIVAVAMMATMAMPGFAATGATDPAKAPVDNKVSLKKTYTLAGLGTSPVETFDFTAQYLYGEMGATDISAVPTISSAEFAAGGAKTSDNTKDVTVDFSNVSYKSVGIYYYKISETNKKTAGVTYAPAIGMKVTVGNKDDVGTDLEVKSVSFWTLGVNDSFATKISGDDAFENTYTANTLRMKKTVKGDMGNKTNDYFTYKLTLKGAENVVYPASYEVKGGSDSTNPTEVTVVAGEEKSYTFKLKHNDEIYIENLPAGIEWSVTEAAADGYTAYTEYSLLKKTEGSRFSGTTNATEVKAEFTNVKEGTVDTGVILDNAPYIALLTIVAAGAVFMVIKKRRSYDD